MPGDAENTSTDATNDQIDLSMYRKLVKQFIDMASIERNRHGCS